MNITAATVTAATVTVYFVGLVHFRPGAPGSVDAIVPLATSTSEVHKTVTLDPHYTSIAVADYSSCPGTAVAATSSTAMPSMPPTCRIANLSGVTIELPTTTSTPALTTAGGNFGSIPHLGDLCSGLGGLRSAYVATRLQLTKGQLTAVPHGNAWWAKLVITNASDKLKVGTKVIPLNLADSPEIWILSQPGDDPTDQKKHFYWNYKLFEYDDCDAMPATDTMATTTMYGTGVGCSNTQYP